MVQLAELHHGTRFTLSSFEFEVTHVDFDAIRAAPCQGGPLRRIELTDMQSLLDSGDVTITHKAVNTSKSSSMLSSLPKLQLALFHRRRRYVHAAYQELTAPCSQNQLGPLIKKIADTHHDEHPPCTASVAGWVSLWLKAGRKDMALAPRPRKAMSRPKNALLNEVVELIRKSINAVYMTPQRNPISAVHVDLRFRVAEYNRLHAKNLQCPSVDSIRRIVLKIDKYERDRKRHGVGYAKRHHKAAGRSFYASEPLELVMADGQIIDIILINEDGTPIGRAYATVLIDVRTRCILCVYISLAPFSGATLLAAMKEAVVAVPGKPRGIAGTLVVDNGSDYRHDGLISFCRDVDTTIEPCEPRSPDGKAIVERFFRTLNDGLIHRLPGTSFSNPEDRGDYDSTKYASFTIEDIRKTVNTWVEQVYHTTRHSELGRAPMDVWNEEVEPCQP